MKNSLSKKMRVVLAPGGRSPMALGELSPFFRNVRILLTQKAMLKRKGVFINVPYDSEHAPLLDAIVFATLDCGFIPKLAILEHDSSKTRLERLIDSLVECPLSIHDLTLRRTPNAAPRLNMAFELGVAIGSAKSATRRKKRVLVLERDKYSYQKFISDIAGLDICAHGAHPNAAIPGVRAFLQADAPNVWLPSSFVIAHRLGKFYSFLRKTKSIESDRFSDRIFLMSAWLMQNGSEFISKRKPRG